MTAIKAKHGTLTAATVATVTFAADYRVVMVTHRSSSDTNPIYFTVDGSTPTVAGDDTFVCMPGGWRSVASQNDNSDGSTVIKLISTGTPAYSVEGEG